MSDAAALIESFGWAVRAVRPGSVTFDNGFGLDRGKVLGADGRAEEIWLAVSDFAGDDDTDRDRVRDTFVRMTVALTNTLGAPTLQKPGSTPEVRWAGDTTTLRLLDLAISVELALLTNSYLAEHDRIVEMEDEGLL